MTKHFANNEQRAAAYAAMKELDRMLKADGELPPGFSRDLSNVTVTVTLPHGTSVNRDAGLKKDGVIFKTATQNLYGWAVIYECFRYARKFKQHSKLQSILMKIVRRAVKRQISNEDAFTQLMPHEAEEIAALRKEMSKAIPKRAENTPRMVSRIADTIFATLGFTRLRQAA